MSRPNPGAGNPGSFAADTFSAPEISSFSKAATLVGAMERYDHLTAVSQSFARTSNGGYQVKRIVVLPATESSPEQRLRARLSKDASYAEQTSIKVDLWTPQGWSEVVAEYGRSVDGSLPGTDRGRTDARFRTSWFSVPLWSGPGVQCVAYDRLLTAPSDARGQR